jgi:hypothetical protein
MDERRAGRRPCAGNRGRPVGSQHGLRGDLWSGNRAELRRRCELVAVVGGMVARHEWIQRDEHRPRSCESHDHLRRDRFRRRLPIDRRRPDMARSPRRFRLLRHRGRGTRHRPGGPGAHVRRDSQGGLPQRRRGMHVGRVEYRTSRRQRSLFLHERNCRRSDQRAGPLPLHGLEQSLEECRRWRALVSVGTGTHLPDDTDSGHRSDEPVASADGRQPLRHRPGRRTGNHRRKRRRGSELAPGQREPTGRVLRVDPFRSRISGHGLGIERGAGSPAEQRLGCNLGAGPPGIDGSSRRPLGARAGRRAVRGDGGGRRAQPERREQLGSDFERARRAAAGPDRGRRFESRRPVRLRSDADTGSLPFE